MAVPLRTLGKYEVLEELGRGGMGAVYKGRDPQLDRLVAIKVLAPHLVWEQAFLERFQREARAAARLIHPGIVPIHDVGQEGSNYYFVMAYLRGGSLKQRLAQRGRLPPTEALAILRTLADALDYAHGKKLVHRDVKPANVLFDERGQPMLADFGIVKALDESRFTSAGHALGTPHYMAPEQIVGQVADGRTDQYALGILAYEMLTGKVPFDATTTQGILYKHMNEAPPSVYAQCAGLPRAVDAVLRRALAKKAEARFPTCGEFLRELDAALAQRATTATGRRWPRWAWGAPAVLAVVVLAVVAPGWLGGGKNDDGATPVPRATLQVAATRTAVAHATQVTEEAQTTQAKVTAARATLVTARDGTATATAVATDQAPRQSAVATATFLAQATAAAISATQTAEANRTATQSPTLEQSTAINAQEDQRYTKAPELTEPAASTWNIVVQNDSVTLKWTFSPKLALTDEYEVRVWYNSETIEDASKVVGRTDYASERTRDKTLTYKMTQRGQYWWTVVVVGPSLAGLHAELSPQAQPRWFGWAHEVAQPTNTPSIG